jgi:ATP-dependent helicase/nuclease subunit A
MSVNPLLDSLDPRRSAVVEACAGSGKTWLLVSRMLRLLLDGAAPASLLALTFTRAAAEEMRARLMHWLRGMALMNDADLEAFLRERGVPPVEVAALMPRARGLYEQVLEARPGPTLTTFHGWFMQLVSHAPLAQGALRGRALLDASAELIDTAWERLLAQARGQPDSDTARALRLLLSELDETVTRGALFDFVQQRADWQAFSEGVEDPVAHARERLERALGFDPARDALAELHGDDMFRAGLAEYTALLALNTATHKARAAALEQALRADATGLFEGAWAAMFTKEGTPYAIKYSKAQADRLTPSGEARFIDLHASLADRVAHARDALNAAEQVRIQSALFAVGAALLDIYQRLKDDAGVLDFADLEWHAARLLADHETSAFIACRLDARVRHVLLDEFQDTNPLQWRALSSWLEEALNSDAPPTVFLVGDPKQSIYRFRRAEPRLFAHAAAFLEDRYDAILRHADQTRRLAPPLVEALNAVFEARDDYPDFEPHTPHPDNARMPGHVGLLAAEPAPDPAPQPWRDPLNTPRAEQENRAQAEARAVAARIADIVGRWGLGVAGRPARYADVRVLIRSRTHLAVFETALKRAGIPFISSRAGGLLQSLEADDLSALLETLITPFDDLRLAHALRSPLFGLSDNDLIDIARAGSGSWRLRLERLAGAPDAAPRVRRAHTLLAAWQADADRLPVHDLLDRILHHGELHARYLAAVPAALRPAVSANLDAFVALALALDAGRYPSLSRFVFELKRRRGGREQDAPAEGRVEAADAVRIDTIHGAKGLEAPIVFLIQSDAPPTDDKGWRVHVHWPPGASRPERFAFIGPQPGLTRTQSAWVEDERMLAERERLNLLYVAMTRARQALILTGSGRDKGWLVEVRERLHAALDDADALARDLPALSPTPLPGGEGLTCSPPPWGEGLGERAVSAPPPPTAIGALRPETSAEAASGIAIHRALECLAQGQPADDVPGEAVAAARVILAAPGLARFFDVSAYLRAENEFTLLDAAGQTLRLDRLVVFEHEVWVLDYKTGALDAALDDAALAARHREQLDAYRRALAALYPDRPVRAGIVTAQGRLVACEPA